jgi:hypothetical protein
MSEKTDFIAETMYFLDPTLADDIHVDSFVKILKEKGVQFTVIKEDLIRTFEESVRNGIISNDELRSFIENEIRFGNNRTVFFQEIDEDSARALSLMSKDQIYELSERRGLKLPSQNNLAGTHLPAVLTVAEVEVVPGALIELTFVETIKIKKINSVAIVNNYYFVTLDLLSKRFSLRMRPRDQQITGDEENTQKIPYTVHFFRVRELIQRAFNIEFIDASHYKSTLYRIAKELTEKAEEQWRKEVNEHTEIIEKFADEMKSKLPGINNSIFDLNFRVHRLLERALIQSNFQQLKKNQVGKKGYIHMFNFSDRSGGKIKASSKERERAIDLSEIYYDTRDTIDKEQKFDTLWVYWFTNETNKTVYNRLEANSEYFQIHFFKYLKEDDYNHVLSKVRTFM